MKHYNITFSPDLLEWNVVDTKMQKAESRGLLKLIGRGNLIHIQYTF